jgi:hypothetical protein
MVKPCSDRALGDGGSPVIQLKYSQGTPVAYTSTSSVQEELNAISGQRSRGLYAEVLKSAAASVSVGRQQRAENSLVVRSSKSAGAEIRG